MKSPEMLKSQFLLLGRSCQNSDISTMSNLEQQSCNSRLQVSLRCVQNYKVTYTVADFNKEGNGNM